MFSGILFLNLMYKLTNFIKRYIIYVILMNYMYITLQLYILNAMYFNKREINLVNLVKRKKNLVSAVL